MIVQPTVESVREFKVLTGTFSAEFGRGAGVVSVSTKSGNNEWHGTVFEYLRNEAFDAKNFFALPTAKKAPLDRHQFGASLSGPIVKNKTFFFVDYAGLREDRGQVFVNTVPTEATRRGDFSDYRDRNGNLILIYDPLTTPSQPERLGLVRDPFPGNIIPADRLDQVGLNVASIYPLPNGPGNFDNYTSTVDRTVRDTRFNARVDHRAGDRDSFFVRYSYEKYKPRRAPGPGRLLPGHAARRGLALRPRPVRGRDPEHAAHHHGRGLQLDAPVRADRRERAARSASRRRTPRRVQSDYGHEAATSLGIQGINVNEFASGLPNLNIQDVTGISGGPNFLPVNPKQIHYQVEDTLSWVTGRHSLKTGYRFILRKPSPFTNHEHPQQHRDQPQPDQQPADQQPGLRHRHAAARLHDRRHARLPARRLRLHELGALALRPGRLEAQRPRSRSTSACATRSTCPDTERENRLPNYDPEGMRLVYAGEDGTDRRANKETRWGNLAPRLGVAWDVTGDAKNVIRAGYGKSYFPVPHAAGNLLEQNVPNSISQNYSVETNPLVYTPDRVPPLSNPFPAIVPVKPQTTAELNAANPIVFGHAFSNETPHMHTWQVSYERQITNTLMAEVAYVGSKG